MPPAIPHLLSFFLPGSNRASCISRGATGLSLAPHSFELQKDGDEEDFEQEFTVFYCSCGKSCKIMEYTPTDVEVIQRFLSEVKDCDCELSPDDVRFVFAPTNASRIPLHIDQNKPVSQVTSDSFSMIENEEGGFYDLVQKRMISGSVSSGYTLKLYPTKRPTIFYWSKCPGRQDIIRDVTFSASRGRTKLPKSFTVDALRALIGKSQIAELVDWEITVNKFIAGSRNSVTVTDLLYIVSCPFILRYVSLTSGFITRDEHVDVWPPLLDALSVRGSDIRNTESLYRLALPDHLQSSIPTLKGVSSGGSFYIPALILLAAHFQDPLCFGQLCRNLTLLSSSFMTDLMRVAPGTSPEMVNRTIAFIASKVNQRQLADILASCLMAAGYTRFHDLVEAIHQESRTETSWAVLEDMPASNAKDIGKFLTDVQRRLIEQTAVTERS